MKVRSIQDFGKVLFAAGIFAMATGPVFADGHPKAVVELFTSQGCSSCPAADKILASYAKSDDVLALAFHVDYWNYLGWKDTFSKAEFSDRQRRYAASFHRRGIYTPQAVVNGRDHVVGSSARDIKGLMTSYSRRGEGLTVPISTKREGEKLRVIIDENSGNATLWIIYFNKVSKVAIKRGENRGKTIAYHNIVREISMLGMMKEGKLDLTLPLEEMRRKGHDSCAIILQKTTGEGTPGAIIGASVVAELEK